MDKICLLSKRLLILSMEQLPFTIRSEKMELRKLLYKKTITILLALCLGGIYFKIWTTFSTFLPNIRGMFGLVVLIFPIIFYSIFVSCKLGNNKKERNILLMISIVFSVSINLLLLIISVGRAMDGF